MFLISLVSVCGRAWGVLYSRECLSAGFEDMLQHSPSSLTGHTHAEFPLLFFGWRWRGGTGKETDSSGLFLRIEGSGVRRSVQAFNCANSHRGRQNWRWVWRLQWLGAVPFLVLSSCGVYHRHCMQDDGWVIKKVWVFECGWYHGFLPSIAVLMF